VFFFQAEDGIRDDLVTGVQTCALPIYMAHASCMAERPTSRTKSVGAAVMMIEPVWLRSSRLIRASRRLREVSDVLLRGRAFVLVSEERRVGKECRWKARGVYVERVWYT